MTTTFEFINSIKQTLLAGKVLTPRGNHKHFCLNRKFEICVVAWDALKQTEILVECSPFKSRDYQIVFGHNPEISEPNFELSVHIYQRQPSPYWPEALTPSELEDICQHQRRLLPKPFLRGSIQQIYFYEPADLKLVYDNPYLYELQDWLQCERFLKYG